MLSLFLLRSWPRSFLRSVLSRNLYKLFYYNTHHCTHAFPHSAQHASMTKALHTHFPFHHKDLDREVVSRLELKSASSETFMSRAGVSCLELQYSGGLCRKFSVNLRPGRAARPCFKRKKRKRKGHAGNT